MRTEDYSYWWRLITMITYNDTKKDLPVEQLHHLFYLAGWAGSENTSSNRKTYIRIL